ncbi:unnamed protein product [Meloidogyne enterolobii]|uniref:Uncharacterized protein n=1 Tax=Meloidogyne enterolobii TaxID=390850 RepID=A0ACB0ZGE2_MELEN
MFSSSTKICLFFLSIFILLQLNNGYQLNKGDCIGYGRTCTGKGKGNCCAGLCSDKGANKGTCCIVAGSGCNDKNDKRCCPGSSCTPPGEIGHSYTCL